MQVLEAPPPPTLEDLLANRLRYLDRKAVAERRLGDEADERDVFLVARMNGAVLAVDFILRSLERLGTAKKLILGKNLAILSSGEAVYFPTGQMPSKDHKCCEHIKDMSRSQWSNRHAIHETLLAGCALSPPGRLEAAIILPTFCGAEELGGSFC